MIQDLGRNPLKGCRSSKNHNVRKVLFIIYDPTAAPHACVWDGALCSSCCFSEVTSLSTLHSGHRCYFPRVLPAERMGMFDLLRLHESSRSYVICVLCLCGFVRLMCRWPAVSPCNCVIVWASEWNSFAKLRLVLVVLCKHAASSSAVTQLFHLLFGHTCFPFKHDL